MRNGGTSGDPFGHQCPDPSEATPPGTPVGSKTMAPMMCRWVVGDSRARNAPSRPVSGATASGPSTRSRPVPRAVSSRLSTSTNADRLHPLDHQLGDPVPPPDPVGDLGVGVDQQDRQLVPVPGVDQSGRVEAGHPVTQGQAAPRLDEAGVALGEGQGDAGRHHRPSPVRLEEHLDPGHQVGPGVAGMGVGGQRQVGVEPHHRDGRPGVGAAASTVPGPGLIRSLRSSTRTLPPAGTPPPTPVAAPPARGPGRRRWRDLTPRHLGAGGHHPVA